ncbi:hypothetical protein ACFQJ7_16520 [Halovenus rubra]|uniref:Uncharacterized protein n=2 Tax=Halovenus rubra TaxID=869890 RepID=A0ABD5XAH5_9EURY|nr:hypothetical protein [Halovenus rubra]
MDRPITTVAGVFVVGVLIGASVAGAFGMYFFEVDMDLSGEQDVADVEAYPEPPERPTALTNETATEYTISFEERRLYNEILGAHSSQLVGEERVVNVCRTRSVRETGEGFRVELSCAGGIDNRDDTDRQAGFEYSVTYRVTETTTEQVGIERFPYEEQSWFIDRPATTSESET